MSFKANPPSSIEFPCLSLNLKPNAFNKPVPASFVALPPKQIINSLIPFWIAHLIRIPVPYVEALEGLRSCFLILSIPEAEAMLVINVFIS